MNDILALYIARPAFFVLPQRVIDYPAQEIHRRRAAAVVEVICIGVLYGGLGYFFVTQWERVIHAISAFSGLSVGLFLLVFGVIS